MKTRPLLALFATLMLATACSSTNKSVESLDDLSPQQIDEYVQALLEATGQDPALVEESPTINQVELAQSGIDVCAVIKETTSNGIAQHLLVAQDQGHTTDEAIYRISAEHFCPDQSKKVQEAIEIASAD